MGQFQTPPDLLDTIKDLKGRLAAQELGPYASMVRSVRIVPQQFTGSATYTTLTTPDQVTVSLPTGGLIHVWYWAAWQESVSGAGRAAIFLGNNQLKIAGPAGPAVTQAAATNGPPANNDQALTAAAYGLVSSDLAGAYGGDVATGQVLALGNIPYAFEENGSVALGTGRASGGPSTLFADPGTYTVSVQFKASSGTVRAQNRRLIVAVLPQSTG